MVTIQSLTITGIRSFSPETKCNVNFDTPLTLILGQNGCGKTTIIEAIKYALCGEHPSGSDGGRGFVCDPKLVNRPEVKAQVILRFTNAKSEKWKVTRNCQVIMGAMGIPKFKSLDGTLNREGQGHVSNRCMDLNANVSFVLNVSNSILTNVVFCHQEDSDWPLQTGKKVKEKFDSIFGIDEYNKCMENIKKKLKDMKTKQDLLEKDVENKEFNLQTAEEKKRALEDTRARLQAVQDQIAADGIRRNEIQVKYAEVLNKEKNLGEFSADVYMNSQNRKQLEKEVEELEKEIKDANKMFAGTKEELGEELRLFGRKLQNHETGMGDLENQKKMCSEDECRLRTNVEIEQQKLGQFMRENEENADRTKRRNDQINELAADLLLKPVDSEHLNKTNGFQLLAAVKISINDLAKESEMLQMERDGLEIALQEEMDAFRENKAKMDHESTSKRAQMAANKSESKALELKLEHIKKAADNLEELSRRLKHTEEELREEEASLNANHLQKEIANKGEECRKLEANLGEVDREVKVLQSLATDQANLAHCREIKENYEREKESLMKKNGDNLKNLLKVNQMPNSGLSDMMDRYLKKLAEDVKNLVDRVNEMERNLAALKANRKHLTEKLLAQQRLLANNQEKIYNHCGSETLGQFIGKSDKELELKRNQKGMLVSSQNLFGRYIDKIQVEDVCPVCLRGFDDENYKKSCIDDLQKRLNDIPQRLNSVSCEVDKLDKEHSILQQLKPVEESVEQLKNIEIPNLKKELEGVDFRICELESSVSDGWESLMAPQSDEGLAKSMQSDVIRLDQLQREIDKVTGEIETIEIKLASYGTKRTLDEAVKEQDEMKGKISMLRKSLEVERQMLSKHKEETMKLRERKNEILADKLKVETGISQLKSLVEKRDGLMKDEERLRLEADEAEKEANAAFRQLSDKTDRLCELKEESKRLVQARKKRITDLERKLEEVEKLQAAISDYKKKGGWNCVTAAQEMVDRIKRELKTITDKKAALEEEIESGKSFIAEYRLRKMDLDNNLKLMQKKEELIAVKEKLKMLKGQMGIMDANTLTRQKITLKSELDDFIKKMSNAEGRTSALQESIAEKIHELDKPYLKNAEINFRTAYVELAVLSRARKDLSEYYKAMDWSIIHFHKEKMAIINAIVKEYWKRIYKGNDIEYIEINADETKGNEGRRSFNYKVSQVRDGVSFDLPGRCSAGQKVLACLIIRMALAETFSKNCGILTLDEPTTNLDKNNINSLAEMLSDIVNRRRVMNKKFQLIVITHDEEFLDKLTHEQKLSNYIKVYRDGRGLSNVQHVALK